MTKTRISRLHLATTRTQGQIENKHFYELVGSSNLSHKPQATTLPLSFKANKYIHTTMSSASILRFLEVDLDHEDEFEHSEHDDDSLPWNHVILACFLVQLITLSGIALTAFTSCTKVSERLQQQWIPSFSSGALIATVVFLLIPESIVMLEGGHESHTEETSAALEGNVTTEDTHLEGDDHDGHDHFRYLQEEHEEEGAMWKFGVAVLGGFLIPVLLGALFPTPDTSACEECEVIHQLEERQDEIAEEGEEVEGDQPSKSDRETIDLNCEEGKCCHGGHEDEVTKTGAEPIATPVTIQHSKNWSLASSILIGDALHNFVDGVFLANAFMLCDASLGYTMVASTIYHELAQEISDYALLVHHCGLKPLLALALNFCAGFSILGGAIVVMLLDLSETGTGALLAMSAGVYLFIAACECIPRVSRKTTYDTLVFLACFALGAVPIGLVLLNHGHCDGGHDDHEDH